MKLKITFVLLFFTSSIMVQGQIVGGGWEEGKSACSNYNAFLNSANIQDLQYYALSVSPSGTIRFDLSKSDEYEGVESLYSILGIDNSSNFVLVKTTPSRFDENKSHYKYQQYYQGIKVLGGGATVSTIGGDPGDPCAKAYMLSPSIHTNININATPSFPASSLGLTLPHEGEIKSELVITLNQLGDCEYHLVWMAMYSHNGVKVSWVDAHTGTVLKTSSMFGANNAPTVLYGDKNIDDSFASGEYKLISNSSVSVVKTYTSCPALPDLISEDDIPTTTNNVWSSTDSYPGAYQTHYVVTTLLPALEGIGIKFDAIDAAFCHGSLDNAYAMDDFNSSTNHAWVVFGETAAHNIPYSTFDIAAHELTHAYLYDYIPYFNDNIGNQMLHEAIADMVGEYTESIVQGYIDWQHADDHEDFYDREFTTPTGGYDCYSQSLELETDYYLRGNILRYWFYLISNGDAASNIPALGIEKAIKIVLESVNLLGDENDFEEMRDATLDVVYDEFGVFSPEGQAVRNAWDKICLGSPINPCSFDIVGSLQVCEEDDHFQLCTSGGTIGANYRWYFPIAWTVLGASGNSVEDNCLTVTNLPKYDWYPRYFKVTVKLLGCGYEESMNVKIVDCNGDDPTCEEYHSLNNNDAHDRWEPNTGIASVLQGVDSELLKVYDITGRLLYDGSVSGFEPKSSPIRGVLILKYFDKNGQFIRSAKVLSMQ